MLGALVGVDDGVLSEQGAGLLGGRREGLLPALDVGAADLIPKENPA